MADEAGKSQTTSRRVADNNAVQRTETKGGKTTGKVVQGGVKGSDANEAASQSPAVGVTGDTGPAVNDSGINQPGSPVNSDTSTQVTTDSKLTDAQFNEPVRSTPAAADDTTSTAKVTADVVPSQYREKYAEGNGTCGDFIATEVSAMFKEGGTATITSLKAENDIPQGRWQGHNPGMQRMNLSNVLRAMFLRGETIKIGGKEYSLAASLAEFEGTGEDREPLVLDNQKELDKFLKMVDLQVNDRTRAAVVKALSPKPEKAPAKTPEQRAAEKKERDEAKAKERAEAKAKRDADAAEAKKAKVEAAEKLKAEKAEAREAAKKAKAEAAEKVKAEKAEAAAKAKADKDAKAAAAKATGEAGDGKVEAAVANREAGEKPTEGSTK